MKSVGKIIKKNLKLLIRAKTSALIVIFGPLLIIFLVGVAFDNTDVYRVNVGVYSEEYNDAVQSFLENLIEKQFKVIKYDSEEACIDAIKQAEIHTCMVFASNFEIAKEENNKITFHIDYSKLNIVWMILDTVSEGIAEKSTELSMGLTEILLNKLEGASTEIENQKPRIITLTNENNDLVNDVTNINEKLEQLDLRVEGGQFNFTEIQNQSNKVADLVNVVTIETTRMMATVRNKIQGLGLNDTAEDEVVDLIDRTKEKLTFAAIQTQNRSVSLQGLIDDLQTDVNSDFEQIESKLSIIDTTRTGLYEQIGGIKNSLNTNLDNIASIDTSLDSIKDSISSIEVTEAEKIASPISTSIKPVTTDKTYLNYLFPSLIVMVIMFISILLSSTLVIMEKKSKAFFRNFISPAKDIVFISATYLTSMLLLVLQLIIILVVSSVLFKAQIITNFVNIGITLLLIASLFTLFGMFVGYLFNTEETTTLASISFGTVFLFLSNVLIPLESMPEYFMKIAKYNPFVIGETAVRKVLLFQTGLSGIKHDLFLLMGYCVIAFVLIIMVQKLSKRMYVSKYSMSAAPKKIKKKK